MADIALGHLLALAIEQTDAMLFMRPVEADKPKELVIHPIRLHSAVGHRDACQSLYWRSRRKPPTGHPSRPLCGGTSPTQVLVARVGIGGSQQIGPPPVYQDRLRTSERVQGGQNRRRLRFQLINDGERFCPRGRTGVCGPRGQRGPPTRAYGRCHGAALPTLPGGLVHSALMPANFTTLPHFSVSSAMSF